MKPLKSATKVGRTSPCSHSAAICFKSQISTLISSFFSNLSWLMFLVECLSRLLLQLFKSLAPLEGQQTSRPSCPIFHGSLVRRVWLCLRLASRRSWLVSCPVFSSAG